MPQAHDSPGPAPILDIRVEDARRSPGIRLDHHSTAPARTGDPGQGDHAPRQVADGLGRVSRPDPILRSRPWEFLAPGCWYCEHPASLVFDTVGLTGGASHRPAGQHQHQLSASALHGATLPVEIPANVPQPQGEIPHVHA